MAPRYPKHMLGEMYDRIKDNEIKPEVKDIEIVYNETLESEKGILQSISSI